MFSETWCAAKGLISAPQHDYTGCRPTPESSLFPLPLSLCLPPTLSLSLAPLPVSLLPAFAPSLLCLAFKGSLPNMQLVAMATVSGILQKKVSNESGMGPDVPHVQLSIYLFKKWESTTLTKTTSEEEVFLVEEEKGTG